MAPTTAGVLVPFQTTVDTTADSCWTPVRVAARLAEPVVGLAEQPAPLDGPVSWGVYLAAVDAGVPLPPLTPEWAVDFALPLATWARPVPDGEQPDPRLLTADGRVWGWACSRALYDVDAHTAVDVRRKPATAQMARYTGERKHHSGLGPHKARSVALPAVVAREVHWWTLADPDRLRQLLDRVTHLGRNTRHGHGRILTWTITEDEQARTGWQQRPTPATGGRPDSVRAPYWHPTRRLPCT